MAKTEVNKVYNFNKNGVCTNSTTVFSIKNFKNKNYVLPHGSIEIAMYKNKWGYRTSAFLSNSGGTSPLCRLDCKYKERTAAIIAGIKDLRDRYKRLSDSADKAIAKRCLKLIDEFDIKTVNTGKGISALIEVRSKEKNQTVKKKLNSKVGKGLTALLSDKPAGLSAILLEKKEAKLAAPKHSSIIRGEGSNKIIYICSKCSSSNIPLFGSETKEVDRYNISKSMVHIEYSHPCYKCKTVHRIGLDENIPVWAQEKEEVKPIETPQTKTATPAILKYGKDRTDRQRIKRKAERWEKNFRELSNQEQALIYERIEKIFKEK